ncbi:MAG: multicopper oxidase domain-containing protein [Deltaproteobacteria bacterium]|jgi:FtsP/CotA-like multicopper oxidase with cupredoxin domain|nr:multicopper oxidase domain-containing protein [Deltaproteobacteria bacterium]
MINRRQFFHITAAGAAGLLTGGMASLLNAGVARAAIHVSSDFNPDLDVVLKAAADEIPILPGAPTDVWRFKGQLLDGDPSNLVDMERSYLGPIIRARTGQKIRIRFNNAMADPTIVHWHGLHVPAEMDGHPRLVIPGGETYVYEFEIRNRAGTYWYHPHPHGLTGPQVYGGLAGLFLVSDDEEEAAGLPSGEYDIPLVLQDRAFDRSNQLIYLSGHHMEQMNGFLGDWIMVNGQPDFSLPVATRAYRLRLLNGSNARIYRLAWKDGRPLTVIGTDGGLLEEPVQRRYVMLGPGERVELWADFSNDAVGSETALVSLPFDDGMLGGGRMGRGMMGGGGDGLPNGAGFTIFRVRVNRAEETVLTLPQRLSAIERYDPADAVNPEDPKRFHLVMRHMAWTINGRTFQMEQVAAEERVALNSLEVWEFINEGGGMGMMGGMAMPHPIHLHGMQFQVLQRRGVTHEGYVDEGWKDTVLLMPGERVRVLARFGDYAGLFLYHCHNLEHEDMGMMRNYLVENTASAA